MESTGRILPHLAFPEELARQARQLWQQLNQARRCHGLGPLEPEPRLQRVAQRKAEEIASLRYWDHRSPSWGSPADMLRSAGLVVMCLAENLACAPDPELAHRMLMGSLEHRYNILYPHFTHVGIGVARGGSWGMVYVELFAHLPVEGGGRVAYDGYRRTRTVRVPAGCAGGNGGDVRVSVSAVQHRL